MVRACTFAALAAAASVASADVITLVTTLDGAQEVPQNATTMSTEAIGTATLTIDTDTRVFSLELIVTGLALTDLRGAGANMSPIHLHAGTGPGSTGGIVVDLGFLGTFEATADGFVLTVTDAEFGGVQGNVTSDSALNVANLLASNLYYNVHTNASPSGEIRGDIIIPAPATALVGAAGVLLASRRRRA